MTGSKGGFHHGKQRAKKGAEGSTQIEQAEEGDAEREEGSQAEADFVNTAWLIHCYWKCLVMP
jgi:hypothetical protein